MEGDEQEVSVVIDALFARVKANPRDREVFSGLIEVGLRHEPSAGRLIELMQQIPPANVESRTVPSVAGLGQKWPEHAAAITELLTDWSTSSDRRLAAAAKAVLRAKKG